MEELIWKEHQRTLYYEGCLIFWAQFQSIFIHPWEPPRAQSFIGKMVRELDRVKVRIASL